MNLIKMYKIYKQLMKNQWLDIGQIREIQRQKLRYLVDYAYKNVSYYKKLFDKTGISPADIKSIEDFKKLPITNKSDLQSLKIDFITSRSFCSDELMHERTSGSTGRPFTIYFDKDFVMVRDALFLRGLRAAGYKPRQRLFLISGRYNLERQNRLFRWKHVSVKQSSDVILGSYNQFKPHVLYGCTAALRILAQHIRKHNKFVHRPERMISTAEMLDESTKKLLEETFNTELFDFYGLTETGLVGWECPEHRGYHLSEDANFIEFVPDEYNQKYFKFVITNLNLRSMPFIRYDTGDLIRLAKQKKCSCGRGLSLIEKIEGRTVDCIKLKNGQTVSPYMLTCEIEKLNAIIGYQVIQKDYDEFMVKVEFQKGESMSSIEEIDKCIRSIIGEDVRINIKRYAKVTPKPGQKFRVIESRLN